MYFDQGEQRELKVGRMLKRAQGKSKLGTVNWKERVFVLTPATLRYFEGTNEVGSSPTLLVNIKISLNEHCIQNGAIIKVPFNYRTVWELAHC